MLGIQATAHFPLIFFALFALVLTFTFFNILNYPHLLLLLMFFTRIEKVSYLFDVVFSCSHRPDAKECLRFPWIRVCEEFFFASI